MWDEETGEREIGRDGRPAMRPKAATVRCETHAIRERMRPGQADGACPKGHWRNRPDLDPDEEQVIELYRVAKSTGGSMLTGPERASTWLLSIFARLAEVDQLFDSRQKAEQSAAIMALINRG